MRLMPSVLATLVLAANALPADAAGATRYVELVNRAHESVTAIAVAPAGADAFREVPLARRLRGGGGAVTVGFADAGCRFDIRLTFRDGRAVTQRGIDVCRSDVLQIGRLPRGDANELPVLAQQTR